MIDVNRTMCTSSDTVMEEDNFKPVIIQNNGILLWMINNCCTLE